MTTRMRPGFTRCAGGGSPASAAIHASYSSVPSGVRRRSRGRPKAGPHALGVRCRASARGRRGRLRRQFPIHPEMIGGALGHRARALRAQALRHGLERPAIVAQAAQQRDNCVHVAGWKQETGVAFPDALGNGAALARGHRHAEALGLARHQAERLLHQRWHDHEIRLAQHLGEMGRIVGAAQRDARGAGTSADTRLDRPPRLDGDALLRDPLRGLDQCQRALARAEAAEAGDPQRALARQSRQGIVAANAVGNDPGARTSVLAEGARHALGGISGGANDRIGCAHRVQRGAETRLDEGTDRGRPVARIQDPALRAQARHARRVRRARRAATARLELAAEHHVVVGALQREVVGGDRDARPALARDARQAQRVPPHQRLEVDHVVAAGEQLRGTPPRRPRRRAAPDGRSLPRPASPGRD